MLTRFECLQRHSLAARDGEIGKVREFYFDDQDWSVRYLVVDTGGWLSNRPVLIIPEVLRETDGHDETIPVRLTKDAIRNSPSIDFDKPVSRQREEELHHHYQWQPYWMVPASTAWAAVVPPPVPPEQMRAVENAAPLQQEEKQPGQNADPHLRSSAELANRYNVHAIDGEIGQVCDFVLDDAEWKVRYLVLRTGRFFGKDVLISPDWIERISASQEQVIVNLPRAAINDAPGLESSEAITRPYEQRLYDHYQRRRYWSIPEAAGSVA